MPEPTAADIVAFINRRSGPPTSDRGGMQQCIRALRADGWELHSVGDGEDEEMVSTERAAIAAIEATGMEWLYVTRGTEKGAVFFVLGNAPDEVICDYTVNLTCVDTLTNGWY